MRGTDHIAIEAAAKAKRSQSAKHSAEPPKSVSSVERAVSAGIWVAAAGSLVAVMLT